MSMRIPLWCCFDNVVSTLRNFVEREAQTGVWTFINLASAHDILPSEIMQRILTLRLRLPHFVKLLRAMYSNTTAVIRGSTHAFNIRSAAGVESPRNFNVCFDAACHVIHTTFISELGDEHGVEIKSNIALKAADRGQKRRFKCWGKTKLYGVMYVDACFTSVAAVKRRLEIIEMESCRHGLTLSRPKTESMVINRDDKHTQQHQSEIR